MIQNKWKNVLVQKGMTQAQAAKAAGINAPLFSLVVNGAGVLSMDDLSAVCKVLDIQPEKVYPADVLKIIYGVESRKSTLQSVSIKLTGKDVAFFDFAKRYAHAEKSNKDFILDLLTEYISEFDL